MNVTENMHRIQVAANAWYAAMRHQFDEALHQHWDEFDEDDDGTDRERPR